MTFVEFLRALQNRWRLVVALALIGAVSAGVYSFTQEPIYRSDVQLFISIGARGSDISQLNQGSNLAQERVKSYTEIVNSSAVCSSIIEKLGLPYSAAELGENISVSNPPGTVLLDVSVIDESSERARDIATALTAEFSSLVDEIETSTGQTSSPVKISVTQPATAPTDPVSPQPFRDLALGLFGGLAVGAGTAAVRQAVDRTIRGKSDASKAAGAPVLGSVPEESKVKGSRLIAEDQATPRAEAYRQLRTNVRFLSVDRRLTSFVVTGSLPAEGKTTTAANFAIALAQSGQSVVLVDADLRRPTVADLFALSNGVGLTNVLLGEMPVNHALQQWRGDVPLYILAAGPRPPNPSELLGSPRLKKMIESLEASGMTVVFDSPPLLPVTDAAIVARVTGGAIVVTRVGKTRTDQLAEAVGALRAVGAQVLGIVANRVKGDKDSRKSTYYDVPTPRRSRSRNKR